MGNLSSTRRIELLAPARNVETGIAAINSGADAVYIGAAQFGARQAAGNSVEDIARLVQYAHLFGVKIYVTLNTILRDDEIAGAVKLVSELYDAGVDALIVQDMAIAKMNIPPIPLHCSTQMDNCTAEKVEFLAATGFPRVVLARELSLQQISQIHARVPQTELEVFVHGALCVSYSGRCYASQHCFGRSANRGACAQFCRLPFSLVDADGAVVCKEKHLLSLKDMNRSGSLEALLDAGATSLKIEGRLKDASYVKNITAHYRKCLDEIFARRTEYTRASFGVVSPQFTPSPAKSFNRGFTDYFLGGERSDIASFDTPKSMGECVGRVKFVSRNFFTLAGGTLANGDGACFIAPDGKLQGFRINSVENGRVFPQNMPQLFPGAVLYRNYDNEFERELSRPDAPRRLSIELEFGDTPTGFFLAAKAENGVECRVEEPFEKAVAQKAQRDNIVLQLSKWGNTPFVVACSAVTMASEWFVPSSLLGAMRRKLCDELTARLFAAHGREKMLPLKCGVKYPAATIDYRGNVANSLAREFYKECGVESVAPAYEIEEAAGSPIMYCKHCIKFSLGWCSKRGGKVPYKEPLMLLSADGRRFRLSFDCRECLMTVLPEK